MEITPWKPVSDRSFIRHCPDAGACAADWAAPVKRGRVVELFTDTIDWRAVYLVSAVLTAGILRIRSLFSLQDNS